MAAFRARAKSSAPNTARQHTPEESKQTTASPTIGVPVSTEVDAFITPISSANVLPSPTAAAPSPAASAAMSAASAASRRDSVRGAPAVALSNISRHDNGWSPSSSPEPATLAGDARAGTAAGTHGRAPSSSPTAGSGLVLSYKSDGESGPSKLAAAAERQNSTAHLGSWAEAQAAQKAKEAALLTARRRREEQREQREKDLATREAEIAKREADVAQLTARSAYASASASSGGAGGSGGGVYGGSSSSSPLTARSRAAQEGSGYIVPASGSREILGALAMIERKKKDDQDKRRALLGATTPRSGPGNFTPRGNGSSTQRGYGGGGSSSFSSSSSSSSFDPSQLDYEDASGSYAAAAFLPMSARGAPALPLTARGGGSSTSRASSSGASNSAALDRRRELVLAKKEQVRRRKAAALAAITAASTPVEQGGTLVLDQHGQVAQQQMRREGEAALPYGAHAGAPSTANGQPMVPRGCEMLDFKGVGEKSCVVQ